MPTHYYIILYYYYFLLSISYYFNSLCLLELYLQHVLSLSALATIAYYLIILAYYLFLRLFINFWCILKATHYQLLTIGPSIHPSILVLNLYSHSPSQS